MMIEAKESYIAWKTSDANPAIASVRIRALLPAFQLSKKGWHSIILDRKDRITDFSMLKALILVKSLSDGDVDMALQAKQAGVPILLDICDNMFAPGYGGQEGERIRRNFKSLLGVVDILVVTGHALWEAIEPYIEEPVSFRVVSIEDYAETKEDTEKLLKQDWLKSYPFILRKRRKKDKKRFSDVFRTLGKAVKGAWLRFKSRYLPGPRLLWFGNSRSSNGLGGYESLATIAPYLKKISMGRSLHLMIVSDDYEGFKRLRDRMGIVAGFGYWHPIRIFDDLQEADIILIPNSGDAFSIVKSANRTVMSLAAGKPVIADSVPSLEPLRECMILDDWGGGLRCYLDDDRTKKEHLSKAHQIIAKNYSADAIANKWDQILRSIT